MADIRQQLKQARLYLILDASVAEYRRLFDIMCEAVEHGVDIVQLRDKGGATRDLLSFAKRAAQEISSRAIFILNDRIDLALASGAHGVHLGQHDLSLEEARKLSGENFIIGTSCQNVSQIDTARQQGADYIGFGSVFKTRTKPDREPMDLDILKKAAIQSDIPLFAIGGIGLGNVQSVLACGISRIAVTRAICEAEDVAAVSQQLKNAMQC